MRRAAWLFRHYAIEGRTEMLSPKHGLTLVLAHLHNADFAEGLKGLEAAGGGIEAGQRARLSPTAVHIFAASQRLEIQARRASE